MLVSLSRRATSMTFSKFCASPMFPANIILKPSGRVGRACRLLVSSRKRFSPQLGKNSNLSAKSPFLSIDSLKPLELIRILSEWRYIHLVIRLKNPRTCLLRIPPAALRLSGHRSNTQKQSGMLPLEFKYLIYIFQTN